MEEENQVYEGEILNEDELIEEIKSKRTGRDVKVSDIITIQCILCILLAILAIVMNMLVPQISQNVIEKYKMESTSENEPNDTLVSIVSKLSDLLNSTPNDRV